MHEEVKLTSRIVDRVMVRTSRADSVAAEQTDAQDLTAVTAPSAIKVVVVWDAGAIKLTMPLVAAAVVANQCRARALLQIGHAVSAGGAVGLSPCKATGAASERMIRRSAGAEDLGLMHMLAKVKQQVLAAVIGGTHLEADLNPRDLSEVVGVAEAATLSLILEPQAARSTSCGGRRWHTAGRAAGDRSMEVRALNVSLFA